MRKSRKTNFVGINCIKDGSYSVIDTLVLFIGEHDGGTPMRRIVAQCDLCCKNKTAAQLLGRHDVITRGVRNRKQRAQPLLGVTVEHNTLEQHVLIELVQKTCEKKTEDFKRKERNGLTEMLSFLSTSRALKIASKYAARSFSSSPYIALNASVHAVWLISLAPPVMSENPRASWSYSSSVTVSPNEYENQNNMKKT